MKHISEYLKKIIRIHTDQSGFGYVAGIGFALAMGIFFYWVYSGTGYSLDWLQIQKELDIYKADCDKYTASVERMNQQVKDGDPDAPLSARIRLEEQYRDEACKCYQRAKNGEKLYLEQRRGQPSLAQVPLPHAIEIPVKILEGIEAAKEAHGRLYETDYSKKKREELENYNQVLKGKGWSPEVKGNDDLNRAMAASEFDHILKLLAKQKPDLAPVIEYVRDCKRLDDPSAIATFLQTSEGFPSGWSQDKKFNEFDKQKVIFIDALSKLWGEYKEGNNTTQNIEGLIAQLFNALDATPSVERVSINMEAYKKCHVRILYKKPNSDNPIAVFFQANGSFMKNQFMGKGEWDDTWLTDKYHATGTITTDVVASSQDVKDIRSVKVENSRVANLKAHWTRKFQNAANDIYEYELELQNIPCWKYDQAGVYYWLGVGPPPNYAKVDDPRLKNVLAKLTIKYTTTRKGKTTTTTDSNWVLTQCQVTISK